MQVLGSVGSKIRKLVGARQKTRRQAPGHGHIIKDLPANLSALDPDQLAQGKHDRDERMSILFRRWPTVSDTEMRELMRLSNERQRLARHGGSVRSLHAT